MADQTTETSDAPCVRCSVWNGPARRYCMRCGLDLRPGVPSLPTNAALEAAEAEQAWLADPDNRLRVGEWTKERPPEYSAVRASYASKPVFGPRPAQVIVVTTNDLPGYRILDVRGEVFGVVVRVRNIVANWGASLRTVVGGEVGGYTRLITEARNDALGRLRANAFAVGANAVVAMRFDSGEIGDIMNEVVAYGTAVVAEKDPEPGEAGA
jgi:uncharacterized protein YbjQ (UPF0145 family)